jgi:hypothetical protein
MVAEGVQDEALSAHEAVGGGPDAQGRRLLATARTHDDDAASRNIRSVESR